ncbi:MAG: glycosyltransferase family 4 protein [Patescibacteria group bacterium]
MKIVHISCVAPPDSGGIGQSAYEIVRHLRLRGMDAQLVAPVRRTSDTVKDEPWVVRLPSMIRWGNAAALSGIDPLMAQADIVHLHYPFFGTAEAVAQYCIWHRKPLVMTFHMDASAPFPLGLIFGAYRIFAQTAIIRACKKIFVSSKDYAEHSSLGGFFAMHPERFVELPFGVDHAMFKIGPDVRTQFDIPADAKTIGFVGALDHAHRFKGLPELLRVTSRIPDAHLLIVGDGDQRRVYEAQANQIGVMPRCHFLGRVDQDTLANAYRSMDVFAFPSTGRAEAFGLVAAEAAACGAPCVASDLFGVRTVVKHDETGLLVPPRDEKRLQDALTSILRDRALRDRLSRHAAISASRFDWDRHAGRLVEEYRKMSQ